MFDEQRLLRLRTRLYDELDELYADAGRLAAKDGERDADQRRNRIARILRAFHMIEAGEYETCAVCSGRIARGVLEHDPAADTCESCG